MDSHITFLLALAAAIVILWLWARVNNLESRANETKQK